MVFRVQASAPDANRMSRVLDVYCTMFNRLTISFVKLYSTFFRGSTLYPTMRVEMCIV